MDLTEITALASMFGSAFVAATLLPMQSELLLATLIAAKSAPVFALFAVASIGNTLGAVVNYWLGVLVDRFEGRWWFPANAEQMQRARGWYARWGVWTLLLSWAPFADPLTVVAGVMRTPFWKFLLLVAIAKTGRYAALIWLCGKVGWC